MTRYTEKQKLAAVTAYRKSAGGLRATASAHDVGVDSLRARIAAYEANGKVGLVAKRRVIYDLDFKLDVLCWRRQSGRGGAALEPLYDVHRDFVLGARVLHADETPVAMLDPGAGGQDEEGLHLGLCARRVR